MATTHFKGKEVQTCGDLPNLESKAPDFQLARGNLSDASLSDFSGVKILNIFPSLDTGTCATSVVQFDRKRGDIQVLHISKDLPFAQGRLCSAEGVKSEPLSAFRSSFARDYGVEIVSGAMRGLCARAVLVLDGDNRVLYRELVDEITQEPDYEAAIRACS